MDRQMKRKTVGLITASYTLGRRNGFYRNIMSPATMEYLAVHIECPIFLSDFNQV